MRSAVAVSAAVTASLALAAPGRAQAADSLARGLPIARCTAHRGTIVAVDFAHWGGPVVRGCALHQPTGYELLHAVGFRTAGDQHDGPGFVCRLGDAAFAHGAQYPTPAQENCVLTPPASAYWSEWLAPAGRNHWSYSQVGAMSDVPTQGEVELWTFGGTNIAGSSGSAVPTFTPDELRAPNLTRLAGPRAPRLVDALATSEPASAGSAAPLVIGISAALLLCAAAAFTVWRRRRYE